MSEVDKLDCGCDCTIENAIKMNECVDLNAIHEQLLKEETPAYVSVPPTPLPDGLISVDVDALIELGIDKVRRFPWVRGIAAGMRATQRLVDRLNKIGKGRRSVGKTSIGGGGFGGFIKVNMPKGSGEGGSGGTSDNPNDILYRGGEARLNFNPTPVKLTLDTGIKPDTYVSDWNQSNTVSSPLHITCAAIQIPDSGDKSSNFFDKIITFIIGNSAQGAVNFIADPDNSLLTSANLRSYFNTLLDALQQYYFYNSILTYAESSANRNDGMFYLRTQVTQTDLNNLLTLKRMLQGTPIPPNMNDLCFWINQTYVLSDGCPNASIIKICPVPFDASTLTPSNTLSTLISSLSSGTNRKIATILSRACPKWVYSEIPDVCETIVYDDNFKTMWHNLPSKVFNGTTNYYWPSTSTTTGAIPYATSGNDLDGVALGLAGIYYTGSGTNKWWPSLLTTKETTLLSTGYITNRYSFYNNAFINPYSHTLIGIALSRGEVSVYNNLLTGSGGYHLPQGSQWCEAVSIDTITQCTYQAIEWMLSLYTIGRIKDNREYDLTNPNRPAKVFKSKGKGKSKTKSKRKKSSKPKDDSMSSDY